MIYIVSYPRSGNTMSRYLIELMTGKPTNGLIGKPNSKDNLQPPLIHKDSDDFVAYKQHDFRGIKSTDMVIFILRDWLEAIVRHNEKARGLSLPSLVGYTDSFFSLLQEYDSFKGNKMLWRYEQVQKVAANESRQIYRNAQSGDDPDHHKKKLSNDTIIFLTEYVVTQYNDIYNKYIK